MVRKLILPVSLITIFTLGCDTTEPGTWTTSSSNKTDKTEDGAKTPGDEKDQPKEIEEIKCDGGGVGEDDTAHRLQIAFGKRMGAANGGIEMDAHGRIVAAIDGNIEILNQAGVVENTIPLGGAVYDFDLDKASGIVVAVGEFGVSIVENGAVRTVGNHSMSFDRKSRVSVGRDLTVAVLGRKGKVYAFKQDGTSVCEFTIRNNPLDVEVVESEELIVVGGYTQVTRILQIPWMLAHDYSGDRKWTNYNERGENLGADTRCNMLEFGADGLLYMTGEQAGGGSPFERDPKDVTKKVPNAKPDRFQNPYNLNKSAHLGYIAAYMPSTGNWVKGTWLFGRLVSNGKGNYLNFTDHEVTPDGSVLIAGKMVYAIANPDCVTVNDKIMPGNGSVVAFFDKSFCRRLWISFGNGGDGDSPPVVGFSGNKAVFMKKDLENCVLTEGDEETGNYLASFEVDF